MSGTTAESIRNSDPLRSYVLVLREAAGLSQKSAAEAAGIKPRTYIAWENGETHKIDVESIRSVVGVLGGLWSHIDQVLSMSADQARALASSWLSLTEEEREALRSGEEKYRRVIALADDDPALLEHILRQLRDDSRADPDVLKLVAGYLAGLSSSRPRSE